MSDQIPFSEKSPRQGRGSANLKDHALFLKTLLDTIPNPVFYKDAEGVYRGCNTAFAEQILGLSEEEIVGCSLFDLPKAIPRELAQGYHQQDLALMDNPGTQYYESIVQCADGVKRHFIFNKATFCDAEGKVAGIVGVMLDITERKRVEESLRDSARRLRFLSSKLLSAQECESRRISMEIHDALGQNLAVLKLQLDAISKRLRKDQRPLKDDCRKALGLINQIIESARNLSRDLSPSIIEDLKLGGTLKWMLQDFKTQTGIQTVLEMDDINGLFSNDDEVIIYRIFQEALRNVIKHAEAHRVKVGIERRDREVTFQIADDGKGFDLEKVWNRHVAERSLGLAALYERSRMLGGSLEITSQKGQGTRITLKIAPTENKGKQ